MVSGPRRVREQRRFGGVRLDPGRHRRVLPEAPRQEPPPSFTGSVPEWLVYQELERQGLRGSGGGHAPDAPNPDFDFQSAHFGGRTRPGGLIADFLFYNPPGLAFSILGSYYHETSQIEARDLNNEQRMASLGYRLIFIEEDDILEDVTRVVSDGLRGIDNSRLR